MSGDTTFTNLIQALVRRERLLLLVRGLAWALLLLMAGGLLAVLLVSSHAPRPWAGLLLAGATASGVLVAALAPAFRTWGRAGSAVRQARRVEAEAPALRGRLVTLAERPGGARRGESQALLALAEERVGPVIADLDASEFLPLASLRPLAVGVAALGLALVLAGALGPAGPLAAFRSLASSPALVVAPDLPAARDREATVLGDIVLRYVYPAYTGLEPKEIPNSTGDVRAPPGTLVEIRARTARRFQEAHLLLEGADLGEQAGDDGGAGVLRAPSRGRLPARLAKGREVSASLEVSGPGHWSFVFSAGDQEEISRRHAIAVEPDLAPEVILDVPEGRLQVAWNKPVPGTWTARDDYGVVRVEAAVGPSPGEAGGAVELRAPLDPRLRISEEFEVTPRDLGLSPGEEAWLSVVAWDNDAVGGAKAGRSPPVRLEVLGPRGQASREARMVRELRDALVLVLADHLEETWPPGRSPPAYGAWAGSLARRMEPVERLADRWWDGFEPDTFEGTVLSTVREAHDGLLGLAMSLGEASAVAPRDMVTMDHLRTDLVERLEGGILLLDMAVRTAALVRLHELARQLAEEAEVLAGLDTDHAAELLTRLDRLERNIARLPGAARELGEGHVQAFVNDRVRDARNLTAGVRDALSEGRGDDARVMLERLARDLQDLAEHLEDLKTREGGGEALAEARQLKETLEELMSQQRVLARETGGVADRQEEDGECPGDRGTDRLAEQQGELNAGTRDAERRGGEIARQLPMRAPGLVEGLELAGEQQGEALRYLGEGRPGDARGGQEGATEALAEATAALERAMRDAEDLARFGRSQRGEMAEGDPDSSRERGRGRAERRERVGIPAPEEFRTPEAYRDALLKGMEGEVPREYKTMKRRYYEELVRQ